MMATEWRTEEIFVDLPWLDSDFIRVACGIFLEFQTLFNKLPAF